MRGVRDLVVALGMVLAVAPTAHAQRATAQPGAGVALDTTGAVVPNAAAVLTTTSGGTVQQTTTDAAALSLPSLFGSIDAELLLAQLPAGPPPTPRHTGIKAMAKHVVTNFTYLPSTENLLWASAGGGLALAAHPFDDDVNRALVGNSAAESFFKPGAVLGELYTLLPSAGPAEGVARRDGSD